MVLNSVLNTVEPVLDSEAAAKLAAELSTLSRLNIYPSSIALACETVFSLGCRGPEKRLLLVRRNSDLPESFAGESTECLAGGMNVVATLCPLTSENAAALRNALPYLAPQPLGLRKSVGCGDRLGIATPGHVRAVRNGSMAPIFAQQSMRENARTGRTPQQVMDEALWGVFQEGWRDGFGSDADHLKTASDVDICAAAGFTFYTFDPGDHVNNHADRASAAELEQQAQSLPWMGLDTSLPDLVGRLAEKSLDLDGMRLTISREEVMRAAVKYGKAVAHTSELYRHLVRTMGDRPFELEMSVDETDSVTSLAEHVYIAHELKRLGVRWVSLAPRYVGTFEKGVDYIGDLAAFEDSFARHLAVARTYGPYKLSLHSGSDKFSIYPVAARLAGELVHLKTAGTSYLEATRAIAALDPGLFREMVDFCRGRYTTDRATYHVSADLGKMPDIVSWRDADLPNLLEDFHAREVLHVTFGSVLKEDRFRGRFFATLCANEETYYRLLEIHFGKHLRPFAT